jgi:hypothetical protein
MRALVLILVLSACEDVPDIRFEDPDGSTGTDAGRTDASDAGSDRVIVDAKFDVAACNAAVHAEVCCENRVACAGNCGSDKCTGCIADCGESKLCCPKPGPKPECVGLNERCP